MSTFDKIMLFLGNAALALTGIGAAGTPGIPKGVTIAALVVGAGCTAVAPSVMASKRAPASTEPPKP